MYCPEESSIVNMNFSYPGETEFYKTLFGFDYVKIALIGLVIVGSVVGNVSVIIAVAFNKSMHSTINIYVANLSVADFLISTICMTAFLHKNIAEDHIYPLGSLMCKLSSFSQVTVLTCSVLTLSAIACDRFTAIWFPLRNRITKHRTGVFITAIWLISVAVGFPLLLYRKHYNVHYTDFVQPTCGEDWPKIYSKTEKKCVTQVWPQQCYYTLISVALFFIPAAIMTVAYSLILWKMSVSNIPGEASEANTSLQNHSRKMVLKMAITVLLVFMICWTPLQIIILYGTHRTDKGVLPDWFVNMVRWAEFLAFFNSFCNPIIYGIFNKSFRDSLCLVLRCNRRDRRFSTSQTFQKFRLTFTTSLTSSSQRTKRVIDTNNGKQRPANPIGTIANHKEVVVKQEEEKGADFVA